MREKGVSPVCGSRLGLLVENCVKVAILLATAIWILKSRLAFAPVPWPDGSAFFLPGVELVAWPPQWRMHAQAAFVPSYDSVNFNLMPALPIVLGIAQKLGLASLFGAGGSPLMIKAVSLVALLAWAWLLWSWLIELFSSAQNPDTRPLTSRGAFVLAGIITLAGLWDPVLRWGTLVVRTETWIGVCWLVILRQISRQGNWKRLAWQISAALAVAAYFHFEAIYLVPAVVVALGFEPGWFKRLVDIGVRTTALLSPWLVYVLLNFKTFIEQMQIQFGRLAHDNHWMASPYMIFHSLFIDHGSPHGAPKFFNVGKGIFWLMLVGLIIHTARSRSRLLAGSAVAFVSFFYLWATKAEVWFITLCHLAFWPWVGLAVADLLQKPATQRARMGWITLTATYAVIALAAGIVQTQKISADYRWSTYQYWIDCIEQAMGPAADKPDTKLWQPHVPDTLVELSQRHPGWNLTRTLDFPGREQLAYDAAETMDAMLFTRNFNTAAGTAGPYQGPLRESDREKMNNGSELPFGPWALEQMNTSRWKTQVCEVGPFWAAVLTKSGS